MQDIVCVVISCIVLCLMQVIGLTASVGVGKAKSMQQAVDHVLSLCANLDCRDISTVSDSVAELNRHVNKPHEGAVVVGLVLLLPQFVNE